MHCRLVVDHVQKRGDDDRRQRSPGYVRHERSQGEQRQQNEYTCGEPIQRHSLSNLSIITSFFFLIIFLPRREFNWIYVYHQLPV